MKRKKILIGILIFIGLLLLISIAINYWVKYELPKVLNEQSKTYAITYKNLNIEVFSGNITATDAIIIPKAALKDTINKSGIYAKVERLEINNFKIWPVLFQKKIKARNIIVDNPRIILYKDKKIKDKKNDDIRESVVKPFEEIISVTNVFVRHGDVKMLETQTNKALLSVQNINLSLDGIVITDDILKQKIPFAFQNYKFSCDSVFYQSNEYYHIQTKKITTTNSNLEIEHFEMIPEYSRREFVEHIPKEKDLFTLRSKAISVSGLNWGLHSGDLFVHSQKVSIDDASANIYRPKMPADDLTKKYLYNKLLRDLKFDLQVDTLQVKNSLVVYEEEKTFDKGAGKLTFNNFNLTARNICSGFKREKANDLKIKVKCSFMNTSPLDIDWRFNVMDKSDGFHIMGTVLQFNVEKIETFTKPYLNVTAKGILNEVHFNFTGNDVRNSGDFAIKYDDLKFKVYQKDDRRKVNKFLTAVGNLVVKNDSKGEMKTAKVELDRIQEKSFFNFLWRSVAEGLKKTLL